MQDFGTLYRWHNSGIELTIEQYKILADSIGGLRAEVAELKEEDERGTLRRELIDEQLGEARFLMDKVNDALRLTTAKDMKAAIQEAIDISSFEF